MAITVTICNQKGGSGKTTTAFHVGAEFAERGYKVLLIDMDPQGTLTWSCGADVVNYLDNHYIGVLLEDELQTKGKSCIYPLSIENLFLIPSGQALRSVESRLEIPTAGGRTIRLKYALEPIKDMFDLILIDCPPALSTLTLNGLYAADYLLIPIKPEGASFGGETKNGAFAALMDTIDSVIHPKYHGTGNPDLKIAGYVMNMAMKNSKAHGQTIEKFGREHNILGVIHDAKALCSSMDERIVPICQNNDKKKAGKAREEISQLADALATQISLPKLSESSNEE